MRIHIAHLGDFVGAKYSVPQNPILDAAGMGYLGDFVGASYAVPQNPILDAAQGLGALVGMSEFVNAHYTLPENPIVWPNGVGDMVGTAAMYPIPINSVLQEAQSGGLEGLHGDCGCGCGGAGGCGGGMGDISVEWPKFTSDLSSGNFVQAFTQDTLFSIPIWAYLVVGGLILFMGGEHSYASRGKRAARAARGAFR